MIRLLIILSLLLAWQPNSNGQEFGCHWISDPLPNDSSEVIFKHTYTSKQRPLQAYVTLASTGHIRVYINERNVSRDILLIGKGKETLQFYTFDITRFLKSTKNTIAVWYAPSEVSTLGKQLSLEYYGTDADGKSFYHKADGKWLCKKLSGNSVSEDRECFDATHFPQDWRTFSFSPSKAWQHPTGYPLYMDSPIENIQLPSSFKPYLISKILRPVSTRIDSLGYHIDFGRPFYGTIRLTIRNAKRGNHLHISGLTYTCTGEMDEQAFRRFNFITRSNYIINGLDFKPSWIVFAEGLEIPK